MSSPLLVNIFNQWLPHRRVVDPGKHNKRTCPYQKIIMAKQLKFTFKDKEYVLEFTRRTVTEMEKKGFVAAEVENKPMSTLPALFEGAFLAHHRFEKKEVINEIFSHMTNKEELIGKLAEMYNEPIMALVEEPEESEGNVSWTASW